MHDLTFDTFLSGSATLGDWVALLNAILTPTIAVFAMAVGWFQWKLSKLHLKAEVLDRRLNFYGIIVDVVRSAGYGTVTTEDYAKLIAGKTVAQFLGFGSLVKEFVDEAGAKLKRFKLLQNRGKGRSKKETEEYSQLQVWFQTELVLLPSRFENDLEIRF